METFRHLTLGGSIKTLAGVEQLRQENLYSSDSVLLSRYLLRLASSGSYGPLRLELADEVSYSHRSAEPLWVSSGSIPYWNTEWEIARAGSATLFHRLDRAFIQVSGAAADLGFGKQPVATGTSRLFMASSQTPRPSAIRLDDEVEITQDAVVLSLRYPLSIDIRFLPAWSHQSAHNFHIRSRQSIDWAELGISLGQSDDKPYLGLEFEVDWAQSVLRADIALYDRKPKTAQAVIGIERALSKKWTMAAEAYFNGFGKAGQYTKATHFSTPFLGRYYGGLWVRYQMSPLWAVEAHTVVNLSDPSMLCHAKIVHSVTDEIDLLFGHVFTAATNSESEFGGTVAVSPTHPDLKSGISDLVYASLRWTF